MSNSIEDIKFPSDFLAAIDKTHAEATGYYNDIGSDAKALVTGRSESNQKTGPSVAPSTPAAGSGKTSAPKM